MHEHVLELNLKVIMEYVTGCNEDGMRQIVNSEMDLSTKIMPNL